MITMSSMVLAALCMCHHVLSAAAATMMNKPNYASHSTSYNTIGPTYSPTKI